MQTLQPLKVWILIESKYYNRSTEGRTVNLFSTWEGLQAFMRTCYTHTQLIRDAHDDDHATASWKNLEEGREGYIHAMKWEVDS